MISCGHVLPIILNFNHMLRLIFLFIFLPSQSPKNPSPSVSTPTKAPTPYSIFSLYDVEFTHQSTLSSYTLSSKGTLVAFRLSAASNMRQRLVFRPPTPPWARLLVAKPTHLPTRVILIIGSKFYPVFKV